MAYRVEAAELEPGPHLVPVSESKIAGPDLLGLLSLLLLLAARHQLLGPGAYTWGGGGGNYHFSRGELRNVKERREER